jgi:hypothetical protein
MLGFSAVFVNHSLVPPKHPTIAGSVGLLPSRLDSVALVVVECPDEVCFKPSGRAIPRAAAVRAIQAPITSLIFLFAASTVIVEGDVGMLLGVPTSTGARGETFSMAGVCDAI